MTTPESSPAPENKDAQHGERDELPPKPIVKKMRWPFPIIWIVPIAAAALAGYYLDRHHEEHGTEVTIEFADAGGLDPSQTKVELHGVVIGQVASVALSENHQRAMVRVRLSGAGSFIARQQTAFWIVRPEFSIGSISGLNTILSGPYIDTLPGGGPPASHFNGLPQEPVINRPGMKIVLHANTLGQITLMAPVTYRGIQVGVVQDIRLSNIADAANITIYVWERYTILIRANTEFWAVKGADIKGGLFSGVQLKLDSLQSLLTGGVAFATPEKGVGKPVSANAEFNLNEQPKDDWLKWKPKIPIAPEATPEPAKITGPTPGEKAASMKP